jgi:flagellar biosynthesis protein FlhF
VLTIDSYRIGALQQIQKYGEIMNIPVHPVETAADMRKQLDIHHDADFIFVDTIGKSPNDITKLAEVNQLVRSAGGEVHLALSATTKRSDIGEILRQFEPFNYQAVVVTKLDETGSVGGIISALKEKHKSVSFVTDGQRVPQDIERAKIESFLTRLRELPTQRHTAHAVGKE